LKRGYSIIESKVVKVRKPSPVCEIKFVYKETHVTVVTPRWHIKAPLLSWTAVLQQKLHL